MKFGINLPNFGPQIDEAGIAEWALTAERVGFDAVLLSDHVALTDDANGRSPAPFYECLSTLAWLAAKTTTLRVGAGVLIGPHRHPLDLAHSTATIDRLSGGRLIVGVGVGWTREAFDVLGVPFHRRGRLTDDLLDVLVASWTSDVVTVAGAGTPRRVHTGPRPVASPHPPLWIGGNGRAAIDRVNRIGTGWHPLHPSRDLCQAATTRLEPGREFVPRIFFLPTASEITTPSRPLGYGSLDQIRSDVAFLESLGATTVVLDTDPGDQRLRRDLVDDLELVELAGDFLIGAKVRT